MGHGYYPGQCSAAVTVKGPDVFKDDILHNDWYLLLHLVKNQHFAFVGFNQILVEQVQDAAWRSDNYVHWNSTDTTAQFRIYAHAADMVYFHKLVTQHLTET